MKTAHAKFLEDPKPTGGEKNPLQSMLLPIAFAAKSAAPAPSAVLAIASALALPEDDGPTEDVSMSEESSCVTKSPAPAVPAASCVSL